MGAADCLIAIAGVDLNMRIGTDEALLVTADNRLADVLSKCRRLTQAKAGKTGILSIATQLQLKWSPSIYPRCINFAKATDTDLRAAFGGWPLPARAVRHYECKSLSIPDQRTLLKLGKKMKGATGVGPDSLPYTEELDRIQLQFATDTGKYLLKSDIAKQLLNWRKNPARCP